MTGVNELAAALPFKLRVLFTLLFATGDRAPMDRGIVRGVWEKRGTYQATLSRRGGLINEMEQFLAEWDAWLCPVAATPAFTHRDTGAPIPVDGEETPYMLAAGSYTSIFNLTGNPVVVLPVARSAEGLPIGVQVVGSRWKDMQLLAVAEAVAEVTGGYRKPL